MIEKYSILKYLITIQKSSKLVNCETRNSTCETTLNNIKKICEYFHCDIEETAFVEEHMSSLTN